MVSNHKSNRVSCNHPDNGGIKGLAFHRHVFDIIFSLHSITSCCNSNIESKLLLGSRLWILRYIVMMANYLYIARMITLCRYSVIIVLFLFYYFLINATTNNNSRSLVQTQDFQRKIPIGPNGSRTRRGTHSGGLACSVLCSHGKLSLRI